MRYPHKITKDAVTVSLYRTKKSNGYVSYWLGWYEKGARKRETFTEVNKALKRGREIADNLAAGKPEMNALSAADSEIYAAALARIQPTGLPLLSVVDEYMRHWRPNVVRRHVADVVDLFMQRAVERGSSKRYIGEIKYRLGAFKKSFGRRWVDEIPAEEVKIWIEKRSNEKGEPISGRTKNNWLNLIRSLWNFARKRKALPAGQHALEEVEIWKADNASYSLMDPGELIVLLDQLQYHKGSEQLIPLVALQAWGGIRLEEAKRLQWEDVKVDNELITTIEVNAQKAKTRARRVVDVNESLRSHLAPFRKKGKGPIVRWAKADHIVRRIAKSLGMQWSHNQLRHTCATHLLTLWRDPQKVALALGTSPKMLDSHYRELSTKADAEWWFGIVGSQKAEADEKPERDTRNSIEQFIPLSDEEREKMLKDGTYYAESSGRSEAAPQAEQQSLPGGSSPMSPKGVGGGGK